MEKHLKVAEYIAFALDSRFRIGKLRFGAASILDIIPAIGDVLVAIFSCYLIWLAIKMRIPKHKIFQMIINIAINFFIGLLPVFGEIIYVVHKANLKNLAILKHYAKKSVVEGEIIN